MFIVNLGAEEFDIEAKEILIDKDKETLVGIGSVTAVDTSGKIINSNKITYRKKNEFILAEGDVKIDDTIGNILNTQKASYDKKNEIIKSFGNTEIITKENYKILTENIFYDLKNNIISSQNKSTFIDGDGNIIKTSMFQYNANDNIFSSIGKIKVIDVNKNKYFFKEIHVDTKNQEIVGSDVSVALDQATFGVSEESDPRFVSNDILLTKDKAHLTKGVFTICKERDGKCPPWSLKAKKITHDKIKKTIYYDNAILKVYDIPIFYFPKFFHPDPTVKRQSGFLAPFFTNSTNIGSGFGLPYFLAIDNDKDMTITPKIYADENILLFNEYRQAFRNGFLTLDSSFTKGYKETTTYKTDGSRNHIFANLDFNFNANENYQSDLSLKVQRTSNDTYFRIHDIDTALVDSENTNLESEIKYNFNKDDMYLNIDASVYENLREKKKSDKYEYVLPNIMYGKTFFTEKFGTLDFKSDILHNIYDTNKYKTFLTNDLIWSPSNNITKKGFINTIEGIIRNTNYKTKKTAEYKNDKKTHELNAAISHKTSLPLKKDGINYSNLFSPNFMVRFAPGHMRDLSSDQVTLNYSNLYAINKTSEIEDGLSAVLGFDFKVSDKKIDKEKLAISLGQVFNYERNTDLPTNSSLDQKMSDVVGLIQYNFSEIGNIDYKFSLDHNLNDLNYNEISTKLLFGPVEFNLDYLEQRNHIGREHYASSGITLNVNDNNEFSFSTKRNFKTESTELYDLSYQYAIDCLTAGVVYRREFYTDVDDLEPKNSLMFQITFVPFTSVSAPVISR